MIVDELKKSIILSAITGNLTTQNKNEFVSDNLIDYKDELSFSLPGNWKAVKLIDITDYGKNNSFVGTTLAADSWILELEDIEKDTGILIKKVYQKERKAVSNKNKFKKGDVLYGKLRPYLNKCIIADSDGYCSTEIVPMTMNENIINKYLQLVLMSSYFINYVNKKSYGTKMPRLGTGDAQKSLIPLPPIEEQKRIISRVNELFDKLISIKPIEKELSELKSQFPSNMKKSILNSLFSRYSQNTIELGKIADINGGYAFKSSNYISEGVRVIRISDFDEKGLKNVSIVRYKYDDCLIPYKLDINNIIMCMTGGTVGKNVILDELSEDCYTNQRVATIKVKKDFIPKFVYYCLNSPYIQKIIQSDKNSTNDNISMPLIKSFPIPNITIDEQKMIIDKIEKILPLCDELESLVTK